MPLTILNEDVHAKLAEKLNANRRGRAFIYWEIGLQLNLEYGRPDGGQRISSGEWARLEQLYDVTKVTLHRARAFAMMADTVTLAQQAIADYGTWSSIYHDYLTGREPGEYVPPRNDEPQSGGARGPQRSFNVHPEITERVSQRFGWTVDYTSRKLSELMAADRDYFFNVFEARLLRDGVRPVMVPGQSVISVDDMVPA